MNPKNITLVVSAIALLNGLILAGPIKTTIISTTEQVHNSTSFKHIITSNKLTEEFFVNNIPVLQEEYYKKLDDAEQKERKHARDQEIAERREKIEFMVNAQNKINARLILQIADKIETATAKLQHPALEQYLLFSRETIPSQHELDELVKVITYIKKEIARLIETYDSERLQFYENKLSPYPEKLELLFRSSINEAIKTCDSTSTLKELLTLVAEDQ